MNAKRMRRGWGLLWMAAFFFSGSAQAQISGSYTLTNNQTFTSFAPSTFTIEDKHDTFNLQSYTATFTGTGDFEITASIKGSGGVLIDLTDPSRSVIYQGPENSYTGLTTVRSGILLLDTPDKNGDAINGDLYIGGGPNAAIVTRPSKHNRELIADTSTITIAQNGTLEFNRAGSGNSQVHSSVETFAHLIMDGGTLINRSENERLTTVNIGTVTLLSNSVWDLGVAMTMNIGDVNTNSWTPGAILTIRDWSPLEPIFVGSITTGQLDQIRFELPSGIYGAVQLPDGQIVPTIVVPEASTILLIPLLIGAALWPELRRALRRK